MGRIWVKKINSARCFWSLSPTKAGLEQRTATVFGITALQVMYSLGVPVCPGCFQVVMRSNTFNISAFSVLMFNKTDKSVTSIKNLYLRSCWRQAEVTARRENRWVSEPPAGSVEWSGVGRRGLMSAAALQSLFGWAPLFERAPRGWQPPGLPERRRFWSTLAASENKQHGGDRHGNRAGFDKWGKMERWSLHPSRSSNSSVIKRMTAVPWLDGGPFKCLRHKFSSSVYD